MHTITFSTLHANNIKVVWDNLTQIARLDQGTRRTGYLLTKWYSKEYFTKHSEHLWKRPNFG